ncbi:MAG TPA: UDP-N-acetylmuramate dehydrogenase [Acidimicrobiales bacterium]|nr:UDP-N-acetylmuramate dehydrogenase [Acidimicrobiales bacterium]
MVRLLGDRARPGMPIGPLTTYRVGGPAAVGVVATSVDDLRRVAAAAGDLPVLVVGKGSNLLVSDAGFPGIAVVLDADAFGQLGIDGTTVVAGAALALPALARRTAAAGLHGLEWAVGVPGSVGGGVRMNAGGHGSDIAATFRSATVVDLADPDGESGGRPIDAARADFGYRRSAIGDRVVVVDATFALEPGDPDEGQTTIREIVRWRREHQPGGQNAGSVFVNPEVPIAAGPYEGELRSAGWLIEQAGLKGHRIGTAEVSPKHANFIQADPDGRADDVVALMRLIRATVEDRYGLRLRTENRLIGLPDSQSL